MQEQTRRQRRRDRDAQTETATTTETPVSTDVLDGAECCLADIDKALDECCVTEQDPTEALRTAAADLREKVRVRTYEEWTDQERVDAGDPDFRSDEWVERVRVLGYSAAVAMFHNHRTLYDQSYEQVVGVSNHRDCGCGC